MSRWRRMLWYWSLRAIWLGQMRPKRMHRRGRREDHAFSPAEKLYMRFKPEWLGVDGRVSPSFIHFPDQSVNREKYSETFDVLLPNSESKADDLIYWGVASVAVEDVPSPEERKVDNKGRTSKEAILSFTVEHDPLEDNYGHSELRVYKNGVRTMKDNVSTLAKKAYRTKLAARTRVEIRPA